MQKKILIIGANGQLGRSLSNLLKDHFNVLGSDLNIPNIEQSSIAFIEMDITNFETVDNIVNEYIPDIIINTAAYTNVDQSEVQRDLAWSVNVHGLENIIKASQQSTRIIHISSDYVFDGKNGPYKEEDKTYPISYYGRTKLAGENALRGSRRKYLILRPNVLYQSTTHDQASFFAWVYTSLNQGKKINVVTDQTSNPTWVIPFSQVILKCIVLNTEGIYHYGSDDNVNRYEFALMIARTFDFDESLINPILTEDLNQLAPRPKHSGLCTDKIQSELDVKVYPIQYCLDQIKLGMN